MTEEIMNIVLGEETPTSIVNGSAQARKSKIEQTSGDADNEQQREKAIPILYDVADVVWVKMSGHPW